MHPEPNNLADDSQLTLKPHETAKIVPSCRMRDATHHRFARTSLATSSRYTVARSKGHDASGWQRVPWQIGPVIGHSSIVIRETQNSIIVSGSFRLTFAE